MKTRTLLATATLSVMACSASAECVVAWQAGETPETVADGTVALAYDGNGAITSMSAASDQLADRVIFTGDAMALAADAVIAAPADTLVFSNAVTVADNGGVSFGQAATATYGSLEPGAPTDAQKAYTLPAASAGSTVVFQNRDVKEINIVAGSMYGGWLPNARDCSPYNLKWESETSCVVQMQTLDDGFLKCVKIRLFQDGDNVSAQSVLATYGKTTDASIGNHKYALGDDFDVYPGNTSVPNGVTGYGIKGIKVSFSTTPFDVEIAAPFTVAGKVSVANVGIAVSGVGSIGPDAVTVPAMELSNANVAWSDLAGDSLTLAGEISGFGSELSVSQRSPVVSDPVEEYRVTTAVKNDLVTLFEGASYEDVVEIKDAEMVQTASGALIGVATVCFFERIAGGFRCQFQAADDGYNKCALMEFFECAGSIRSRIAGTYWKALSEAPVGETDFRVVTGASSAACNYNLRAFTLVFRRPVCPVRRFVVNANAANGLRDSTITVGTNVTYVVNHKDALPNERVKGIPTINSKTEVLAGGILEMVANGGNFEYGLNNGNLITVHRGGGLVQRNVYNVFSWTQEIVIDGGTFVHIPRIGGPGDCEHYLNRMTFRDGGVMTGGAGPRLGNVGNALWQVTGTGAACASEGLYVLARNPQAAVHANSWTLEVEDLTGDDEADFVLSGKVKDFPSGDPNYYYGLTRRKTGAGTLLVASDLTSTSITGRWEIAEGTVVFAGSDQLSAARGYELALQGGTLELEDGTENSFASFAELSATSGIALGANARLELPGAPQNWGDGAALQVTLGKKAKLRFGTDGTSLTAEQLSRITANGHRVSLDGNGYLRAEGAGFVIIIR